MREPAYGLSDAQLRDELDRTLPAWQEYLTDLVAAQFEDPPVDTPPLVGDAGRYVEVQREIWSREG